MSAMVSDEQLQRWADLFVDVQEPEHFGTYISLMAKELIQFRAAYPTDNIAQVNYAHWQVSADRVRELTAELDALRALCRAERWVDLNLNETVRYKLNDIGRKIHKDHHDKLNETIASRGGARSFEYREPKVDENGWSEEQLWCLFKDYGPSIYLGCHTPFETTIQVKVIPQPKEPSDG